MNESLELWDYRRRVANLYAEVRKGGPGEDTWAMWRETRDDLFRTHSQTPLGDPELSPGLPYFPYDQTWRTVATFVPTEPRPWGEFQRIGQFEFELPPGVGTLPVFWLDAYGGGIFVPFSDATNGATTYGGGRYILDTVKGADLGHDGDQVTLDFNYAYHPSCVHSYRWSCPLAPVDSRLAFAVTAGERLPAVQ
ncbi:MAG TPA: DUF1684 domain-containing protein [Acidimicrobiia bacterium]